jgi:hypothetical protein
MFEAVAVNVTLVPAHTGDEALELIDTDGVRTGFTFITIEFETAVVDK